MKTEEMINYSVRKTTFSIPSYRNLKKSLGEYDALVEFLECSCRAFLKNHENSGLNFNEYLAEESAEYGIYLIDLSLENYRHVINSSYLLFPYASFDEFISSYINEVCFLIKKDFEFVYKKDASRFERLIISLNDIGINPEIPQIQIDLFNYYRLIRNSVAHKGVNNLTSIYKRIDLNEIKSMYPTLTGLQEEGITDFDDFILCTANIKDIANILTIALEKHINWVDIMRQNDDIFPKHKKYNLKRKKTYIINCLRIRYGVILNDSTYVEILGSLE